MRWTTKKGVGAGAAFAVALGAVLAFVVAVVLVYGIRYEVNDDAIISNIASGAYGGARWRLVYVNILFGFLLRPLYWVAPGLNWFVIVLLALGVCCFALLGALLLRWQGVLRGGILYATLLLLGGLDLFSRFHYVKFGGLYLATGLVLWVLYLGRSRLPAVLGSALIVCGAWMRFDMLFAVGALAAAGLLYAFFSLDSAGRKRALLLGGSTAAVVLLGWGADTLSYRLDEGWAQYTAFNAVRTELSDFKLQYATGEELAALGFSEVDAGMLEAWSFYDDEVFSLERLEALAEALPGESLGTALRKSAHIGLQMLYGRPEHLLLGMVLLGWLLLSDKKQWPRLVVTLALLGALIVYLNLLGRYPQRIDSTLSVAAALFCGLCIRPKEALRAGWQALAAGGLVLALLPSLAALRLDTQDYWDSRPQHAAQMDGIAQDKGTLYLVDTVLVDAANGYDVWHARPEGYFSNIVFIGSWLMASPFEEATLAAYGVENPYRDALGREDVRFVDFYRRELKEAYLREHYGPEVQLVVEEEYMEMNVYRAEA